ncbi:MAG: peptide-methionine (S)-S-oxide reductase MsrA [Chitinophagales bacterium]
MENNPVANQIAPTTTSPTEIATLGGGCFWCVEAIYLDLKGVYKVSSGYAGGNIKNPTYREVCSGKTGHAEVIQITFNPEEISYEEILDIFWHIHNPTTLNQQGADVGTQYRSVIFYHNEQQRDIAERSKIAAQNSGLWDGYFVTEIEPFTNFYSAEDYHQNYFNENPNQPYCAAVIAPKVLKFREKYKDKLKE